LAERKAYFALQQANTIKANLAQSQSQSQSQAVQSQTQTPVEVKVPEVKESSVFYF
jgi:hypothetical protein